MRCFCLVEAATVTLPFIQIMIIILRHFLFNLIKSSECRHNKIMFRIRCPQIFHNEFGFIDSLSFIFFFSDRSLKSTKLLSALSIFSLFLSPSGFLSPHPHNIKP